MTYEEKHIFRLLRGMSTYLYIYLPILYLFKGHEHGIKNDVGCDKYMSTRYEKSGKL